MAEITKQALKVDNNQSFPNNNNGAITPSILRAFNTNMIDSMVDEIGYNVDSASWNSSISQLNAFSASAQSLTTASLLITASAVSNIITFTKGNGTTFNVTVTDTTDLGPLNTFTASAQISLNNLNLWTSSYQPIITNLQASQSIDTTKFTTIGTQSGSWDNTSLNSYTASNDTKWNTLGALSGSFVTESETGSFARTDVSNTFTQANTFTSISASSFVSASQFVGDGSKLTNITSSIALPILDEGIPQGNAVSMNFTGSAIRAIVVGGTAVISVDAISTSSLNQLTQSFNDYTSSTDAKFVAVGASTSSLNAFTASQQTINTNVSASQSIDTTKWDTLGSQSGSWVNVPLDSLNSFTASQDSKNSTLATYTASVDTKFSTLGTQSGSWITESETASFARTNVDNNFTANQTFTNITAVSASFTYVQTTYETSSVIYSSGSNQLGDELSDIQTLSGSVRVQGSLTVNGTPVQTSSVDITSLNAFTASQETKNSTLATYTASVDSSLTNINTFTASNGNTSLNAYTQSNDTKWSNLAGQTGSYVTSAITASSLVTASVNLNTITFTKGDASTFNITVDTGSASSTDISSLNAFTASQETKDLTLASVTSSLNSATASLFTSASLALVTASFSGNTLTFTKGDTSTFGVVIPDNSGSAATTIYEVVYTGESITKGDPLYISGSQGANAIVYKADAADPNKMPVTFVSNETIGAANTTNAIILGLIEGIDLTGYTAGQAIYVAEGGGWSTSLPSGSNSVTQLLGVVTKAGSGGKGMVLNPGPAQLPGLDTGYFWVGGSTNQPVQITSASFATTGSNTFTGIQTLQDTALNKVALVNASGSLMLVANSYTSASSHLSSSTNALTNLIFKYNSNTGDTIISGSGNIFPNAAAPAAGFKRLVGGNNNIYNALAIPQISGSMEFPVSMNANMGSMAMTMRGPVSSSTWSINTNNVVGTINVGASATLHAQGLVSGLSIIGNVVAGTVQVIANQSNLISSPTIQNNNINGQATLYLSSSAATFSNNTINDSGFSLINQSYTSSAGTGTITVSRNTIGGANNTILTTGIADAGAALSNVVNNLIGGASNILFTNSTGAGNAQSVASTIVYGNTLIVTGSSVAATTATVGSAFFGRFNDINGTKDLSAETVFAVGTGTSTSARKTGFLIDSGSNTFIEGTLNVSGATSLNGDLIITGSLTASLQQGYVWVGDATGKTTTVATSSFGGGGAAFPYTGSAVITGSLGVSGSIFGGVVELSVVSTTASVDFSAGNMFTLTLPSASTHIIPTNIRAGQTVNIQITQPTPGTGSVTFSPLVLFAGGNDYQATATGSAVDMLTLVSFNGTNTIAAGIKNLL
jgi:hypothetical protein